MLSVLNFNTLVKYLYVLMCSIDISLQVVVDKLELLSACNVEKIKRAEEEIIIDKSLVLEAAQSSLSQIQEVMNSHVL